MKRPVTHVSRIIALTLGLSASMVHAQDGELKLPPYRFGSGVGFLIQPRIEFQGRVKRDPSHKSMLTFKNARVKVKGGGPHLARLTVRGHSVLNIGSWTTNVIQSLYVGSKAKFTINGRGSISIWKAECPGDLVVNESSCGIYDSSINSLTITGDSHYAELSSLTINSLRCESKNISFYGGNFKSATLAGKVEFSASPGSPVPSFDQLTLRSCSAEVRVFVESPLAVGAEIPLLKLTGSGPFTRQFVGLPDGLAVQGVNGRGESSPIATFKVSYSGGDGNDLVLKLTSIAQ